MKVEKRVITNVVTDDGMKLTNGDLVKFIANGDCKFGRFAGITRRGALEFEAEVKDQSIIFCVMPKSITCMEIIEHNI